MTERKRSERGLAEFPSIEGIGGGGVFCQESSLATEPAIWLTVQGPQNSGYATVQLARLDAHKLAKQLHVLAANHYQLDLCPARYDIPGVISFLCALPLDHEGPHRGARETGPSTTVTP